MKRRLVFLGFLPLFWASAAMAQTPAELESARLLFAQANELHDKGDLQGALAKYKAAHTLAHTPVTGFELGKAYAEQNLLVEARDALVGVAALPTKPGESEKTSHARAEAAKLAGELRGRIPTLAVVVDGLGPGVTPTVTIDGVTADASTLATARDMNPGQHVVRAWVVGGTPHVETVMLKEGELRTLAVHVEGPKAVAPPPDAVEPPPEDAPPKVLPKRPKPVPVAPKEPPAPAESDTGLIAALTLGGIGAASFVTMAITGGLASSKATTISNHCNAAKQCDNEGLDAAASGKTLATVANIALAAGSVFVATGIIVAIATRKSAAPTVALVVAPTVGGASVGLTLRAW
jgi:hypothetical protein